MTKVCEKKAQAGALWEGEGREASTGHRGRGGGQATPRAGTWDTEVLFCAKYGQ